jgi:hypothetical protein
VIILAVSDGVMLAMWVSNLVVSIVLSIVMAVIAQKLRRIDSLESKLDAKTEQIVDQRFAHHAKICDMRHGLVDGRLKDGDEAFDELSAEGKDLAMKMATQIAGLKTWIAENCASRAEQKEIARDVEAIKIDVALAKAGRKAAECG